MMRLLPLRQWQCDACGQVIDRPEVGWVEWLGGSTRGTKAHGFRIVHNSSRCQYPSTARVHDTHLTHLLGPDGLDRLLTLLTPDWHTGSREEGVTHLDEWGELVRRLHIPHYEEARQYWSEAEANGLFADAKQSAAIDQATLLAILARYGPDGERT
jgi:hypothetical protein